MPQYLSPGVYVEEVPSAVKPIVGVGTNTAGFIGIYDLPVGVPIANQDYDPTKKTKMESVPGKGDGENLPYEILWFNPNNDQVEKLNQTLKGLPDLSDPSVSSKAKMDQDKAKADLEKARGELDEARKTLSDMPTPPKDDDEAKKKLDEATKKRDDARKKFDAALARLTEVKNAVADVPGAVLRASDAAWNAMARRGSQEDVETLDQNAKEKEQASKDDPTDQFKHALAQVASEAALRAHAHVPAGKAKLCTTFADFEKYFGSFSVLPEHNRLAHGVYGFFNNGGTRCWVIRFNSEADLSFDAFEGIDEIALVAAPGITSKALQQAIIDHCEGLADRFAILDSNEIEGFGARYLQDQETLDPSADPTEANIKVADYSNFAATYFPFIKVFDVPTKRLDPKSDGIIAVAPSGHMAGLYAHVDNTRGVHKAPANEVPRGVLGVTYQISKAIQDGLNPHGINCIRDMNGDIRVWGARTLGGDLNMDYKYINVRRLMLFLEESIDEGTQWVVFEPNDRSLWAKIVRNVSAFLTNVWRDGALFGSTPQEAFYVKCDDETNPPEVRDLGRVITEIGVAPVKPAEFVIFRISQWAGPQGK
jgi:phage tail sheath protein FI